MRIKGICLLVLLATATALQAASPESAKTPAKKKKITLATIPWRQELDHPPQVNAREAILPWLRELERPVPAQVPMADIPWHRLMSDEAQNAGAPAFEPILIDLAELPWRR